MKILEKPENLQFAFYEFILISDLFPESENFEDLPLLMFCAVCASKPVTKWSIRFHTRRPLLFLCDQKM